MAVPYINTDAVENEVGGLVGPLGAPMSPICGSSKRQRTFSDISTAPNTPMSMSSVMSPTMANDMSPMMAEMSPMAGQMSPMMGMSSPTMGYALPEVGEYETLDMSFMPSIFKSEDHKDTFYVPDDDKNSLELNFCSGVFSALSCSSPEEDQEEPVTHGCPPKMSQLEDMLAQVKSLYETKYGEDVDDATQHVEKDGITWAVTRGSPPKMSQLEDALAQVKSLYKTKYGEDVDDEDEKEEEDRSGCVVS